MRGHTEPRWGPTLSEHPREEELGGSLVRGELGKVRSRRAGEGLCPFSPLPGTWVSVEGFTCWFSGAEFGVDVPR